MTIPDSVTSIGARAFYFCTSLTNVVIGNSVTNIGEYAFYYCTSLSRVYFTGNAPTPGLAVFVGASHVIVYYLPGKSGWGSTFADRPALLWNPTFSVVNLAGGLISCTVTGTPGIPVAFEATTNLVGGAWLRLQTTNLTAGAVVFHDPAWTNYPSRFYRIVGP